MKVCEAKPGSDPGQDLEITTPMRMLIEEMSGEDWRGHHYRPGGSILKLVWPMTWGGGGGFLVLYLLLLVCFKCKDNVLYCEMSWRLYSHVHLTVQTLWYSWHTMTILFNPRAATCTCTYVLARLG